MVPRSLKLLFALVAASFEVTLIHLGVSAIAVATTGGTNASWLVLLVTCLLAAWTTERFTPGEDEKNRSTNPLVFVLCAVVVLLGVKLQAGGGINPLAGWSTLSPFSPDQPEVGLGSPGLVLASLAAWWRGTAVPDHDHHSIVNVLQRGIVGLVLLVFILTPISIVNLGAEPWGALLGIEAVITFGLGLLSLSLARIVDAAELQGGAGAWSWFRSSLTLTALLLVVGTILLTLVSDSATLALRLVLGAIGLVIAILFSPLAALFERLAAWLNRSGAGEFLTPRPPQGLPTASASPVPLPEDGALHLDDLLALVLTIGLYLLPVIVLILLIVYARRRRRTKVTTDGELHESLWNWRDVGADLLGMLKDLRPRRGQDGLRAALDRLRGNSPAERIRRRYVQLLMAGESAERSRGPQQTPLEYAPVLRGVAPTAEPELQRLTEFYDRARYAPDTVTPANATAADEAWAAIEHRIPKENR